MGIVTIGPEARRRVEANPAGRADARLRAGRADRDEPETFAHPDDKDISKDLSEIGLMDDQVYEYEKRLVRKDGDDHLVPDQVWTDANEVDSGQLGVAMLEDITQTKLAALALEERATRLERIIATQRDVAAASSVDLEHVMDVIVDRAMALTRAEGAMVSLIEDDTVVTRAARGIVASFRGTADR